MDIVKDLTPHIIATILYTALFIFILYHDCKYFKAVLRDHSCFFIIIFNFGIFLLIASRITLFYIDPNKSKYNIIGLILRILPILSIITIYAFLIDYILKILDTRVFNSIKNVYGRLRILVILFLILIWLLGIGYTLAVFKELLKIEYKKSYTYLIYFCIPMIIIVCLLSSILAIVYFKKLKKYPTTFECAKIYIILMIFGIFLQITIASCDLAFIIFDIWKMFAEKTEWYRYIGTGYLILHDMLPLIFYILYLRNDNKNISTMMIMDNLMEKEQSEFSMVISDKNKASLLEQKLKNDTIQSKNKESNYTVDSNVTNDYY